MLGNEVILTPEPRGRRIDGVANVDMLPGICIMPIANVDEDAGNRLTWGPYDKAQSGFPSLIAIVDYDYLQGKTADDLIKAGKRFSIYFPLPGDELNMLVQDQSGTGATSDFDVGDPMTIEDATGYLIDGATGTSGYLIRPFMVMEDYNDMAADTRLHVMVTGY